MVEFEVVKVESVVVVDLFKVVLGVLEGGLKKSKKKKGDGLVK